MSALPQECKDRVFWVAVRSALLLMVRAIEERYLPEKVERKKFPGRT
jgi:uncharacterized membrane protein